MSDWFVYMIKCRDGSLYTGITTNLHRRLAEHNQGGPKAAKYLRGRGPLILVFSLTTSSRSEALRLEFKIKALTRAEKFRLLHQRLIWDGHDFLPVPETRPVS